MGIRKPAAGEYVQRNPTSCSSSLWDARDPATPQRTAGLGRKLPVSVML